MKKSAQQLTEKRRSVLIKLINVFAYVKTREKSIHITHPRYQSLKKNQRELISELKLHGFYVQWEIFDIPAE